MWKPSGWVWNNLGKKSINIGVEMLPIRLLPTGALYMSAMAFCIASSVPAGELDHVGPKLNFVMTEGFDRIKLAQVAITALYCLRVWAI
jgi:hypothetical protein